AGISVDLLRVRGFPFHPSIGDYLRAHPLNVVIEQNRDGQLRNMLILETGIAPERVDSLRSYGGLPLSRQDGVDGIMRMLGKGNGSAGHGSSRLAAAAG